jgi:hypothetical protein
MGRCVVCCTVKCSIYLALNSERMIAFFEPEMIVVESVLVCFKIFFWYLSGGIGCHEEASSG